MHTKCVELSRPGSFLIHAHRHALHVDEPSWWRQSDYSAVRRMARSMVVCINLYLLLIISLFLSDNAHYLSLNNAIDISGTCHSSCWDLWTQRWRPRVSVASFSTLMLLHNLAPMISLCSTASSKHSKENNWFCSYDCWVKSMQTKPHNKITLNNLEMGFRKTTLACDWATTHHP